MTITIFILFILYTTGCCLDGPDLKPKWKKCARRFGELNFLYGDDVRNVQLEDAIEINSGN